MKHKPHILTIPAVAFSAAIMAGTMLFSPLRHLVVAQEDTPPADTAASTPAPSVRDDLNPTDVLASVRDKLSSLESLQCEISERVDLSDQRFYASGQYSQASGNRVRLEFKIFPVRGALSADAEHLAIDGPPEDTGKQKPTGELSQVSDGGVLWTFWKNGDILQLTRRNIREILEAADEAESFESSQMMEDLGTGGLQALMARLATGMEFGKVREQTVGETRLLLLSGRWTDGARAEYFNISDPKQPMAEHLPDYVRLFIDADLLVPRRIQYLKKHPEQNLVRPMITLDFRQINLNKALPETWFVFTAPEGLAEEDLTQKTIDEIKRIAISGNQAPAEQSGSPVPDDPAKQ